MNDVARRTITISAHTGLEGGATIANLLSGDFVGRTVHITLWRISASSIPKIADDQARWMYEQWTRVNAFVARHMLRKR